MKTFLMALSIASSLLVTRLQAQSPDRADLLKEERAARSQEATPPQRTTIERGMNILQKARERFERLIGDENGWHYSSGDFPAGAGIRPGVGYSHDGKWVDGVRGAGPAQPPDLQLERSLHHQGILPDCPQDSVTEHWRQHLQRWAARQVF
jgi:hypothetical protein